MDGPASSKRPSTADRRALPLLFTWIRFIQEKINQNSIILQKLDIFTPRKPKKIPIEKREEGDTIHLNYLYK
jgi:hypothetical protein